MLIKIAYAGICHSDIHIARQEWGTVQFPLVPGHEISGIVQTVGSDVTKHAVGDRVGVGCMVGSCRTCENCLAGEEHYCLNGNLGTYGSTGKDGRPTGGGYSTHIVVDQDFVLAIPPALSLDVAAPLLCAGITLYSPLKHWGAGPGRRVAIMGLGGLGHVEVKIAHALGAEITVLSHSLSKMEDARKFGAADYFLTTDRGIFTDVARQFDLIINTVSADVPMDEYLALLRLDGTLVNLGAPANALSISAFTLLAMRRCWCGSTIGGIRHPGNARLLRRTPDRHRNRSDLRRRDQQCLRASAQQ